MICLRHFPTLSGSLAGLKRCRLFAELWRREFLMYYLWRKIDFLFFKAKPPKTYGVWEGALEIYMYFDREK